MPAAPSANQQAPPNASVPAPQRGSVGGKSSGKHAASPPRPAPPHDHDVVIDRTQDLIWRPSDNYFKSPGPVRVVITDEETGQSVTLLADDAEGSPTGDVMVHGKLEIVRPEGTLTGRSGVYHAQTATGELVDAQSFVAGALLRGAKVELLRDAKGQEYLRAIDGYFTTCTQPKPHYHITAREIRVTASRRIVAKHVGFYVGDRRILTLPSLTRSFNRTTDSPLPLPGYSSSNSLHVRLRNLLIDRPSTLLDYDLLLSVRYTPSGTMTYERDLGRPEPDAPPPISRRYFTTEPLRTALETSPPLLQGAPPEIDKKRSSFWAQLTANTFVYNRTRTDLSITRLPEIGLSFRNILNRPAPTESTNAPFPRPESVFGTGFFSPAKWFLNAEFSAGYFQEHPTHTQDSRAGMRADVASPMFLISGPLYVRYGGTAWTNAYGSGTTYALLAPEAELDLLPRRNTLIGAGYRYMKAFGRTPFVFDQLDVAHALHMRYAFLGPHWAYGAEVRIDMLHFRTYDSIFSIRRRLDCLEYGVAYHSRNNSVSLIFNLLPAKAAAK